MKKLLFLFCLLSLPAMAQRHASAADQLKTAKTYLIKEPCSSTGITWLNEVLKKEPNNREALALRSNCSNFQLAQAKELLQQDPKSYKARGILQELLKEDPESEELNYLIAKLDLERMGGNEYSLAHIAKAIQQNPDNTEYRWIRARSLMVGEPSREDMELASRDLNYMAENGAGTAKVYANIALTEKLLAQDWKAENINKTVAHLENAKLAASKAIDLEPEYAEKVDFEGIQLELSALQ